MGFRQGNGERKRSLLYVVTLLRSYFPEIEIIVVEQDENPQLNLEDRFGVKQEFFQNSGAYNYSKAYNIGAKKSTRSILVFGTSDIFLDRESYSICLNELESFDAVTPNRSKLTNVQLLNDKEGAFDITHISELFTFAGGILFIKREAFIKVGGWDGRFVGWGGEDDAMSHAIYGLLKSRTLVLPMYHIDHSRGVQDSKGHDGYIYNRSLIDEILTFHGPSLERYAQFLKNENNLSVEHNKSQKIQKFVLAITTYNRLNYLRECIESFLNTRKQDYDWIIIIADDGSKDGSIEYINELRKKHDLLLIQNSNIGVHGQVNTIIRMLSNMDFDLCFRCDDDVVFKQSGWDDLYWETVKRTGYDHLIFYDSSWRPFKNLSRPIEIGGLISQCNPNDIQGGLYTLTKLVIDQVGYFDEQRFGRSGLGHIDYSFRCCRAGFNCLQNPFDAKSSDQFIRLQAVEDYKGALSFKEKSDTGSKKSVREKGLLCESNRVYIPFNRSDIKSEEQMNPRESTKPMKAKRLKISKFRKADAKFYKDRGLRGFFGFLLKRLYNFGIDTKLYFIPKGIKRLGKILNKVSLDFLHVDS